MNKRKSISILIAEDDADDRLLIEDALHDARLANDLYFVEDGEQLMDFLYCRGQYADRKAAEEPGIILLDLNMPRKSGREALEEIKADGKLRHIPIVVLTTSKAEEDILRTYDLGVSGFIVKPVSFDAFVDAMKVVGKYWLEVVELPT